jgi:hypothetical protein
MKATEAGLGDAPYVLGRRERAKDIKADPVLSTFSKLASIRRA